MNETQEKLDHILDHVTELKEKVEELEARYDAQSDLLNSIQQWRTGNGSHGAEVRIQIVEELVLALAREKVIPRLAVLEADMRAVQAIADNAIKVGVQTAVNNTLNARDRTAIAKLKAWGPIIAAGLAAAAVVIQALLR